MLNFDALAAGETRTAPFTYMVASGVVSDDEAASVRADYPPIFKTGYLPLSKL